jgi:hypothetical protein
VSGIPAQNRVSDTETIRDAISYRDQLGRAFTVFGSNERLFLMDDGNNITDITPAGFIGDSNIVVNQVGYGLGVYGTSFYGTPRNPSDTKAVPVSRWQFDTWGENLIATFSNGEGTWEFAPDTTNAVALTNAPTEMIDTIVTDQRIVMGIRNGPNNIREVIWSDKEDNTNWTPTVSNYAGSQSLEGTGLLIGIYKVQNQILILSETDAQVATYLGAPFVYGFNKVGEQCQPLSPHGVVKTERFAIWLGLRKIWLYDGTLKQVPCEIMDYLQSDVDPRQASKMFAMTISTYNEVWWFYQSKLGSEVDSYFCYDYVEQHWAYGKLARTAGIDRGALRSPVMVGPDGVIWNHEQPTIMVDGQAYVESGPLELQNGERNMAVRYVFPDTEKKDSVDLILYTRQMPTEPDVAHGPYAYENPISTTGVLGREVRMKIVGLTYDWEVGTMRFDVQAIGGGFR